jgi:hypothetical protein
MWYEDAVCGGAREGIQWLRAIGVSTVPLGQKGRRTCHRHADKQLKAPEKLGNPPPFQISPAASIC